jgi:hypothetical protein
MDYILVAALTLRTNIRHILLSYDIACQWHKNFFSRLSNFPTSMTRDILDSNFTFAIPKFHLIAHGVKCQTRFSLNYIPGSARTDGEGIEREWAHINAAATSTREMTAGQRHEVLDDMWNFWNWVKLTKLGTSSYSYIAHNL